MNCKASVDSVHEKPCTSFTNTSQVTLVFYSWLHVVGSGYLQSSYVDVVADIPEP